MYIFMKNMLKTCVGMHMCHLFLFGVSLKQGSTIKCQVPVSLLRINSQLAPNLTLYSLSPLN